jgi:hypothetical protein
MLYHLDVTFLKLIKLPIPKKKGATLISSKSLAVASQMIPSTSDQNFGRASNTCSFGDHFFGRAVFRYMDVYGT